MKAFEKAGGPFRRPAPHDPLSKWLMQPIAVSMASVKRRVLSFAKERFPERKFEFVHFFDSGYFENERAMRDFLGENSVRHEFLNVFNQEHYQWFQSHNVTHLRDGSVKIIEPKIQHRFSVLVEWQGKILILANLNRYEKAMEPVSLLVGAVEDIDSLKSLDRALLMFVRDKRAARAEIEDEIPPDVISWDEIVLPGDTLGEIRADIESFFSSARLYHELGLPYKRGMIFTGPPGNGKTLLCRIIAANFSPKPFFPIESCKEIDNFSSSTFTTNSAPATGESSALKTSIRCSKTRA